MLFAALSAALFMGLAGPGHAADDAAEARRLELARRMFSSMNMEKMMSDMMRGMAPAMTEQMRKAHPALSAEQAQAVADTVSEVMEDVTPKLIDRIVPLYAATFTEQELSDTVAFYESASGRAIMAKMPELTAKMIPLTAELMPEMAGEMRRRLCMKIDCAAPAAKPSKS